MRTTQKCPKCGNREIIRINGEPGAFDTGNNIMVGATVFSAVNVNRYVCCQCGYSEEWIDTQDLNRLKSSRKAIEL